MTGRDFEAELRAEEAARQAEGIPLGARREVWARLERLSHRRSTPPARPRRAMTIAAAVAVTVAGFAVAVVALRPVARLGELEVASRSGDLAARVEGGLVVIEGGAATLVDRPSGLSIQTVGPVSLRREAQGVRLARGRIDVTAAHRPPAAAPATIFVSHGAIEVMGTAFTVVQEPTRGQVVLREGAIRFRSTEGAVLSLRPGETLAWPLPPAASSPPPTLVPSPAPARAPAAPRAPVLAPVTSRPPTDEELLEHVEELRSRGRFEQAARALRRALVGRPNPTRERLSFELGSLLTHQIADARRACAQWAWHERHFPDGRYQHEVASARAALACRVGSRGP